MAAASVETLPNKVSLEEYLNLKFYQYNEQIQIKVVH